MLVVFLSGDDCIVPGRYKRLCSHPLEREYSSGETGLNCEVENIPVCWLLVYYNDLPIDEHSVGNVFYRQLGKLEISYPWH